MRVYVVIFQEENDDSYQVIGAWTSPQGAEGGIKIHQHLQGGVKPPYMNMK